MISRYLRLRVAASSSHSVAPKKKKKRRQSNSEMILSQLPRLNFSIFFTKPPLSLLHTHLALLPKHSHRLLFSPKSTLSVTEPIPVSHVSDQEEDAPVPMSLEKLFVPPETQVSVDDPSLSTRILKGSNIVLSKYARDAQVVQAEFVKSSVRTEDCPSDGLPEFALVGRSNVGKSSLLNSLVRRKKLALTSKKPGEYDLIRRFCISIFSAVCLILVYSKSRKDFNRISFSFCYCFVGKTQCINHFRINDKWYLVDLPGYGYGFNLLVLA
ncbi:hypothetical protein JRO89_XS03G0267700 [Xanthoceras sorbifolium]|uniref:EngB-type G domain-containing protein n=1 Tax=Xanthoceras sorbifolium TaxID=99658 RepID=A0ABQ8IC37_9ROSI|nr:hypothetical protein JRO89_XS03G0267700 [Xanthoceras sorbifolium]